MLLSFLATSATIDLTGQAQQQNLTGANEALANGGTQPLSGALSTAFQAIMVIALLAVLFNFIWGAIEWITAGGEKGKIESARNKITGSIIGLIVLAATTAFFMLIQKLLGVQVFTFMTGNAAQSTTRFGP